MNGIIVHVKKNCINLLFIANIFYILLNNENEFSSSTTVSTVKEKGT